MFSITQDVRVHRPSGGSELYVHVPCMVMVMVNSACTYVHCTCVGVYTVHVYNVHVGTLYNIHVYRIVGHFRGCTFV